MDNYTVKAIKERIEKRIITLKHGYLNMRTNR